MSPPRVQRVGELVVVGVLLAGTAWLGKLAYHNQFAHGPGSRTETVHTAPIDIPATSLRGQPVEVAVQGRERSLMLLVLSTDCPYCEQNMPEWRRLVQDVRVLGPRAPEVLALSVSAAGETRAYLDRHDVDVPVLLIDPSVLQLLGLQGYPSTVTIDPGRAMASWSGVLDAGEQRTILSWARTAVADSSRLAGSRVSGN